MATTARTRRPASATADKPQPAAKSTAKRAATPAAKKQAATAQPATKRPAPARKTAPRAATAPQPSATTEAKKAAAKKKATAKAPVQQELVLEEPGTASRARKATAKTAPRPADPAPAAKQPAAKKSAAKRGAKAEGAAAPAPEAVAAPPARKTAAKSTKTQGATAAKTDGTTASKPAAAPAKAVSDQGEPNAKSAASKSAASTSAPRKSAARKSADHGPAKKAPAPHGASAKKSAAGKKASPGRRGTRDSDAPAESTVEDTSGPAPDLLAALALQADPATADTTAAPAPATLPAVAPASQLAAPPEAPAEAAEPAGPAPEAPEAPAEHAQTYAEMHATVPASGLPHSRVQLVEHQQQRHLQWQAGRDCPRALDQAARARADEQGRLDPSDDGALPTLLRLAAESGHRIDVDPAVWQQLAADRDARHRLHRLEAAYPGGPSSPALQSLLQTTLPAFQAEGALFAVVAGRALIADERGLGKRVQAIAAATLWRRHFGVHRVLVLCTPAQRADWQHSWQRLAAGTLSVPPQVIEGPLHQRQALWSGPADVRILAPEALDTDAAHLAQWAPELLIIDEPQQLSGWQTLQAPHALVLCGAPLVEAPALLQAIIEWLDVHRQGALQAVLRIRQARDEGLSLSSEELERLDNSLSRLMLQRQRSEVQDQLPPCVHSERLVPLAPPQREAHERLRTQVQRLLAGWQRCGFLSDADQWQLSAALRALPEACHRSQPGDSRSGLAEASIAALQAQLDDWAATGTARVAVVCATPADQAQLAERLRFPGALQWLAAGEAPGRETEVVLQVGVPWRMPMANGHDAAPGSAPQGHLAQPGQQWVYLAAQDSLEQGLMDTLLWRQHTACGPAETSGTGFLHGQRLADWLQAWNRALQATPGAA